MNMIDAKQLVKLYTEGGRDACVKELCVFPAKNHNLNITMEKIVDCFAETISGVQSPEDGVDEMNMLSERLRLELNDVVLDLYNEDEITPEIMVNTFDQLRNAGKQELSSK
jgi:hypothetical protein